MGQPLRYLFVPYQGPVAPEGCSPRKWRHAAVWDCLGRNRMVAGLASGLASAPRPTLRGLGVKFRDANLPDRVRQRVVVLAETAEHARRLGRLLPGWEVLDAVPGESDEAGWAVGPTPEDDPPLGRVATLMYVARYGIGCDVLVRATAGTGRIGWDVVLGGANRSDTRPALVVDVADGGHGRMETNAGVRRREYREQGLRQLETVRCPKGEAT